MDIIPASTSSVHPNAQALSTLLLDERWQAMEEKASRLFEDGYGLGVLTIGGGKIRDEESRRPCKHLEGLWRLAAAQSRWYGQRREALWQLIPCLDAWDRLTIHMGARPQVIFHNGQTAQAWRLIIRLERAQRELQALHSNLLLDGDMWLPETFEKFVPLSPFETNPTQEAM